MKKILFVIESLSGGGAEKILVDLIRNLDKSKYDITVLAISEEGVYTEEVKKICRYQRILPRYSQIESLIGKIFYNIKYKMIYLLPTRLISSLYIKEKFDIEVAFVEGFATKFVSASPYKNKKLAWVHVDFETRHWSTQIFGSLEKEKKAYDKFSRILCVSKKVSDSFRDIFGMSEKVSVQYNPLDTNTVEQKAEEKLAMTHKVFRFITVGRLVEQKGYDRLVEVANKLRREDYKFEVIILGEGTDRKYLEEKIKEYNLESYICLLGFQRNPYKYMRESDMFLCTSRAEGFSTVATEALVLGLPILTTDCAGMKELFGTYECGIITPNNEEGIYLGMKRVLSDTNAIKRLKKDIAKRAHEFDIRKRILEIEELFDEKDTNYE